VGLLPAEHPTGVGELPPGKPPSHVEKEKIQGPAGWDKNSGETRGDYLSRKLLELKDEFREKIFTNDLLELPPGYTF
jgi:hypothetical protein